MLTEREWLLVLADLLDSEGELFEDSQGERFVRFSEEFAQVLADRLRAIADKMEVDHG